MLAAAAAPSLLPGQVARVQVAWPVLVSADAPTSRHAETILAINPRDPANFVLTAIRLGEPVHTVVYASHDAGGTWARARSADGSLLADSTDDPALTFDGQGRVYFTARATPSIRVRRSVDGGATWDLGTDVPGRSPDRPWVFVAPDDRYLVAVAKQEVLLLGGVGEQFVITVSRAPLSKSNDDELHFAGPLLHLPRTPGGTYFHAVNAIAEGPGNTVVISMSECDLPAINKRLRCRLLAAVSRNGGWTYGPTTKIADMAWPTDDQWASLKGAGVGGVAVDRSNGATRGRLYAVWSDLRAGRYQVAVSASADTGRTWSAASIVNDDTTRANHSNPGIAVNSAGIVGVVWNDRRSDPADDCFKPFFAASADGGRTFGPNVPISSTRSCTATPGGKPHPERFAQGGDTFGVATTPDGAFHAAWVGAGPDTDPRTWRLFVTKVVVR